MDRLLTGLVVMDCFCFISLLDGRKTIFFFLYDFFFFGNKIPKPNKIRSKKRQRIQFRFPKKKHLRSHTTASSFSPNSSDQGRLAPRVLPATLVRLLQQPSNQLLQVLPGFQLFLQTLFHPFVLLQGEKERNEDAINAHMLCTMRYFRAPGCLVAQR